MVRILPDGLGHDERRLVVELRENLHSLPLRGDEAMLLLVAVPVRPDDRITLELNRPRERLFHFLLCRPALLIGGKPQVAAGDEINFLLCESLRLLRAFAIWFAGH